MSDPPKKLKSLLSRLAKGPEGYKEDLKGLIRKHTSGDPKREITLDATADAMNFASAGTMSKKDEAEKVIYRVLDKLGNLKGKYTNKTRARNVVDKLDNEYGGVYHHIEEVAKGQPPRRTL